MNKDVPRKIPAKVRSPENFLGAVGSHLVVLFLSLFSNNRSFFFTFSFFYNTAWIEGEVWFFDKYIIPLAKKLAECGVFGVASDEYLNYALENRKKLTTSWTRDGDLLVEEYLERYKLSKTMKHQHHQPAAGAAKQSNLLQIEE